MSHQCPTVVINCIDFRFWKKLMDYLKEQGIETYDYIGMAGGAKNLIDEDTRAVVFKQLDICTDKHCAREVYLVNHIDCGAYGGSAAFESEEKEREKLFGDLEIAAELIKKEYPQLEIVKLLNTFKRVEVV